jgi:hypothetical protein
VLATSRKRTGSHRTRQPELQNGESELALASARKCLLCFTTGVCVSHLIVAQALDGKGKDDEIAKGI